MVHEKDEQRRVVARFCFGGIGDHLSCLIGAWWFAKRTGRSLVVDWRGSRFNNDSLWRHNCFYDYFRTVEYLGGVRTVADDSVGEIRYSPPFFPAKWTENNLKSPDHVKHTSEEVGAVNRLVCSDSDRLEPTVIFNQWIHPLPTRGSVRQLLKDLQFKEHIRAESHRFWSSHVGENPGIGLHIRHGNGENIGDRAAYWLGAFGLFRQLRRNRAVDMHRPGLSGRFKDNMPASLVGTLGQKRFERRLCAYVANEFERLRASRGLGRARAVLFTDSPTVVSIMRELLPQLIVFPKSLFEDGAGPLHQVISVQELGGTGAVTHNRAIVNASITKEMFIEVDLLRRCSGLICMESGFSILSRFELDEFNVINLKPTVMNRVVLRAMRAF